MKNIRPIKTEADYEWALAEITPYFDNEPAPNTAAGDRFDVLAALIAAYEEAHYPITAPDPVETIKAYMEFKGHDRSALTNVLGSRSRASEVLSRHRRLTLDMVHQLNVKWHIPAEALVAPYHLASEKPASSKRQPKRAMASSK